MPAFVKDLDTPLLQSGPHSVLDLRTLLGGGVSVLGGTGSGKTSGTGRTLASALLRAGAGLLVLCAKPSEVDLWRGYARANGRARSVIVFDEKSRFNFLDWLIAKYGLRGLGAITDTLMRTLEAVDLAAGGLGGVSQESFWRDSSRVVLNYAIPPIYSAHGRVTVPNIVDFITSAATEAQQYVDPTWAANSYAAKTLRKAVDHPSVPIGRQSLDTTLDYWFKQYPAIPSKTRGNTNISLTTKLDRFVQPGILRDIFSSESTNIVPEMTFEGAIIIAALPVLTYAEDGIIAQHLLKYAWMRAVEGRNALEPRHRERPVALWADEAQHFVSLKDDEFLSTCRDSRACVVFMSQNLPSFYSRLGENRINSVNGLIGKFNTHIFHLNACSVTNEWASKLIGRGITERGSRSRTAGTSRSRGMNDGGSTSDGRTTDAGFIFSRNVSNNTGTAQNQSVNVGDGTNRSESETATEYMENLVEPNFFSSTALKVGGPANRNTVTGLMFRAGGNFRDNNGQNTLLVSFKQGG